ncbi:MAG: hypothetical protein WKF75_11580 [Singulisphaera sp.]
MRRLHAGAPATTGRARRRVDVRPGGDRLWLRGPPMGRVSGTVTFQGKPLEKGTVTFISTDSQRPNATGTIQAGSYTLQTTEPGDGAVVGDYKIAVSDIDPDA